MIKRNGELRIEDRPSIFGPMDEAAEAAADQRAFDDIAAGRVYSHEAIKRWILSKGTAHPLPPPQYGE